MARIISASYRSGTVVNALEIAGGNATGDRVEIAPIGADANINLALIPKGTGGVLVGPTATATPVTQIRVYSQSLDVASVAASTSAEQTFTVTGLATGDKVFVNKPTASAGLGVVNARVSAADTLAITFGNFTGLAIDPAAETYAIMAIRS